DNPLSGQQFIPTGTTGGIWYVVQGAYDHGGEVVWSPDIEVQTPAFLLGEDHFEQEVRDKIQGAADNAQFAREDALAALDKANEVEDLVGGLSSEVLDQLAQIIEDLGGLSTGDIQELRGIALAGLNRGWAQDPTFA